MSDQSERVKSWRKRLKIIIVGAMGGSCQICAYNRCMRALEFHHLDPAEKDFSFGYIMSHCKNWELIKQELKKCILLCSNCHKEVHAGITQLPSKFHLFDLKVADAMRKELIQRPRKNTVADKERVAAGARRQARKDKDRKRAKLKKAAKEQTIKKTSERVAKIMKSGLDFSRYGWATKVAEILSISPQKVTPWVKRNMPDFYEEKCFKRTT